MLEEDECDHGSDDMWDFENWARYLALFFMFTIMMRVAVLSIGVAVWTAVWVVIMLAWMVFSDIIVFVQVDEDDRPKSTGPMEEIR